MPSEDHHTPIAQLEPGRPPPEHYYAENLLVLVRTVQRRYGDLLDPAELGFGASILTLPAPAQRLYARLIGRRGPLIREDRLAYAEVDDLEAALGCLADAGFIARCPDAPPTVLCQLLRRPELEALFAPELAHAPHSNKAERIAWVAARIPAAFLRWRMRRAFAWLAVASSGHLDLYRLLFFGDRRQDLTTFVMRDLGVHRFEPIELCRESRLFADRPTLTRYLELAAMQEEVAALGKRPDLGTCSEQVLDLVARLRDEIDNRTLERRRSRVLNQLGRNLERAGADQWALRCFGLSTLAPARERCMRILHRLGDRAGVERLRRDVLLNPESTLEADFAARFTRRGRRPAVPTTEIELETVPAMPIEQYAAGLCTAFGGTAWHLENDLPMAIFALAYWSWMFAPIEGAFLHPFQVGPRDLYWPDFFATRANVCSDPLAGPLKARVKRMARAKEGTANRLFSWHRCPREVIEAFVDAVPEADLRALLEIVRHDLAGKRSGFPDLTIVYGPGRYEFVEVKGPTDQLQAHQHLWIQALRARGLPVRVLRFRLKRLAAA